jgi:hypothetical protein
MALTRTSQKKCVKNTVSDLPEKPNGASRMPCVERSPGVEGDNANKEADGAGVADGEFVVAAA